MQQQKMDLIMRCRYDEIPGLSEAKPAHGKFDHPGQRVGYLAFVSFMHRATAYRFAWVVEHDVRYAGHPPPIC